MKRRNRKWKPTGDMVARFATLRLAFRVVKEEFTEGNRRDLPLWLADLSHDSVSLLKLLAEEEGDK